MIGQFILAQPRDQHDQVRQFVITREWSNALEVLPGQAGVQSWKTMRIELDGPKAWDVLGRCRDDDAIRKMIVWLKENHKRAPIIWDADVITQFGWTADLLEQCLSVSNLVGAKIIAEQPFGNGRDEFIVLFQTDNGLMVVPTNIGAYGATRFLSVTGKFGWHIIETSPGIGDLKALIVTLGQMESTVEARATLIRYLEKMLTP